MAVCGETGYNNYGQLGDGTKTQRTKFTKVVNGGVKEVSSAVFSSVLLNDKNELCVTGWNNNGQLGTGESHTKPTNLGAKADVIGYKCYPRPGGCPATGTRCGPQFNQVCSGVDTAIFCNEDNGWCGNTAGHRDAQPSTAYDASAIPAHCKSGSGGGRVRRFRSLKNNN